MQSVTPSGTAGDRQASVSAGPAHQLCLWPATACLLDLAARKCCPLLRHHCSSCTIVEAGIAGRKAPLMARALRHAVAGASDCWLKRSLKPTCEAGCSPAGQLGAACIGVGGIKCGAPAACALELTQRTACADTECSKCSRAQPPGQSVPSSHNKRAVLSDVRGIDWSEAQLLVPPS